MNESTESFGHGKQKDEKASAQQRKDRDWCDGSSEVAARKAVAKEFLGGGAARNMYCGVFRAFYFRGNVLSV
eukprot:2540070-Pleurochrysis_carterae.AAC.1